MQQLTPPEARKTFNGAPKPKGKGARTAKKPALAIVIEVGKPKKKK